MRKHNCAIVGVIGILLCLGSASAVAQIKGRSPIEQIRKALMNLPYYGVFDFIAFNYDQGTVTLVGYAYHPALKADAERAVKRVPGVDAVRDQIEELPPNQMDEELRWKTYYAIYGDPFLSRYAPGGGVLWGMHRDFPPTLLDFGPSQFPGMEPAGDYPIHIIVKNGRIALYGVVDSESDKRLAEMRAREVPGAFGVENNLIVYNESKSSKR